MSNSDTVHLININTVIFLKYFNILICKNAFMHVTKYSFKKTKLFTIN